MGVPGNADLLLLKTAAAAGGYQVSRSLRFNGSVDNSYLSRTPASAGNRKTWSWSAWVKRCTLGTEQAIFTAWTDDSNRTIIRFNSSDAIQFLYQSGGTFYGLTTNQVFRDVSAWYHLVFILDTSDATSTNRAKIYVNGSQVSDANLSAFSSGKYPPQNTDYQINSTSQHLIGARTETGSLTNTYGNYYVADIWFLDGIATDPSSFAETDATTGQWVPKAYTGSKGTNGFHLEFADNSAATATTLGKDTANSNNWTPNNFSVTAGAGNDSLVDTPTSYGTDTGVGNEVRGNYCTLNPLDKNSNATLSNGNLDYAATAGSWKPVRSTIGITGAGKWYWEILIGGTNAIHGIATQSTALVDDNYPGIDSTSYGYIQSGVKYNNGSSSSYGNTFTTNDVIGVAYDAANGKLWFSKNGTWQASGDPAAGTNAAFTGISTSLTYFPMFAASVTGTTSINFGQRQWAYAAPAGFKALCDTNLTAPVIAKPSTVMDVALYTGNFSSKTITGLAFQSDLVWIKTRGPYAGDHNLFDAVRGTGNRLRSNTTDQEDAYGGLTAFNSSGFTLEAKGAVNGSGESYVAWCFDAGATTTTSTAGSINSQVRANASAGFSIVSYNSGSSTGNFTLGHGLNVAPKFIIHKSRSTSNWWVYHASVVDDLKKYMQLNSTNAIATNSNNMWGGAFPTSSVFGVTVGDLIGTSQDAIAYVFSPVAGYSSFGSYTGNGSTDGPFVYTGFRPAFVMLKSAIGNNANWTIVDNKRDTYNVAKTRLFPSDSQAENTGADNVDILSNGFKLRVTEAGANASGGTYIYACFAENPFQYARAR